MTGYADLLQRLAQAPKKGARVVARTFYRELRRAGFADRDIMAVADELLACLMATLREYRIRKEIAVEREEDRAPGEGAPSPGGSEQSFQVRQDALRA